MEKLDKKTLLDLFFEKAGLWLIVWDCRWVIDFFWKKRNMKWNDMVKLVIKSIIEETFFDKIEEDNLKKTIENIKEYDPSEYINSKISIHTVDFIDSMNYFDIDIEIIDTDKTITDVLVRSQYQWYEELFENIRESFLEYINYHLPYILDEKSLNKKEIIK